VLEELFVFNHNILITILVWLHSRMEKEIYHQHQI